MRGSPRRLESFTEADQATIVQTRGGWLTNACWGGYVAVLAGGAGLPVRVLRAPLGDLACYHARIGGAVILASDLSLLVAGGLSKPALHPPSLARHLAAEAMQEQETCLAGVVELPAGERLTIAGGSLEREKIWSPFVHATERRPIVEPAEAARRVRDAALHCVAARALAAGPVLLKLSGGLDSSILAACLAEARAPFTCLNLVTNDPAGDERVHARAVATAVGAPLKELFRDPSRISFDRSEAHRLPRPSLQGFTQESTRLAAEAAAEAGASAIFDGGGGDNIFCSLQSARPAADCLMSASADGQFWRTARSAAQLSEASLWSVALRAWRISRRPSPAYRWPLETRYLSADARAAAESGSPHSWLDPPPATLPGKAAHVALVAAALSIAQGRDRSDSPAGYSPLMSQPLVETCLQIPSWLWFEAGLNRAVARRAFEGLLPPATLKRRSKGAPDGFIAEIYSANRKLVRPLLLDGVLRRHGLLDIEALAPVLQDDRPVRGHDYLRIMQLADAEAWARCWS